MKRFFIISIFILASFIAVPTHAQTHYDCVPAGQICAQVYSEHWEFDGKKGLCYQPFAQCGGSRFTTEQDCLRACAHLLPPISTTPAPTAQPSLTPTVTISVTTITPEPTDPDTCLKEHADANGDGTTSLADFEIFRQEFLGVLTTKIADFNCDGHVSLADFEIFRQKFTREILY